MEKMEKHSSI